MTTFFRFSAIIFALLWSFAAQAQFIVWDEFNTIQSECDDGNKEACEKRDAGFHWLEKHQKDARFWPEEAVFNTHSFFEDYISGTGNANQTSSTHNLIDARYSRSFSGYRADWVFAIDMVCPQSFDFRNPMPKNCAPKLRMIKPKKDADNLDLRKLPTTLHEYANLAGNYWQWEEADIRSCNGALKHLLHFPEPETTLLWGENYRNWIAGKSFTPSEGTMVLDGDKILLRARIGENPIANSLRAHSEQIIFHNPNGGRAYLWAKSMVEIVEPCLKPSEAPAPWEKVLAYEADQADTP